jgi:hypothetical protein
LPRSPLIGGGVRVRVSVFNSDSKFQSNALA